MTRNSPHRPAKLLTRRSLLSISAGGMVSAFAGCAGTDGGGSTTRTTTSQTSSSSSVFESVTFEDKNMVVELVDDHSVTQINLIDPDGNTFAQEQVAEGATAVNIQILSLSEDSYLPGTYKLVAVSDDSSRSKAIDLRPEINITEIAPQLSEEDQSTGKLLVTVENTGSGPTWVYNIGYEGAPFEDAPQVMEEVVDTSFERPTTSTAEIIPPGGEQTFLKRRGVLIIDDSDEVSCNDETTELTVVVQTVHGDISQKIEAHLSGGYNVQDAGSIQHPCKEVSITLIDGGGTNG